MDKKTNITRIASENAYPSRPVVITNDCVMVGPKVGAQVVLPFARVSAASTTGDRKTRNCTDVLFDEGSFYRVRLSLKRVTDLLGLARIHHEAAAKFDKIKCWGWRESIRVTYIKIEGHNNIFPVSASRPGLMNLIKSWFPLC